MEPGLEHYTAGQLGEGEQSQILFGFTASSPPKQVLSSRPDTLAGAAPYMAFAERPEAV